MDQNKEVNIEGAFLSTVHFSTVRNIKLILESDRT